jgi:hypothetical protein
MAAQRLAIRPRNAVLPGVAFQCDKVLVLNVTRPSSAVLGQPRLQSGIEVE